MDMPLWQYPSTEKSVFLMLTLDMTAGSSHMDVFFLPYGKQLLENGVYDL